MRFHVLQIAISCAALCGPGAAFSQDYFPLAVGYAWNYLVEEGNTQIRYSTTYILKDSTSVEGYPLYAASSKPDSLSLGILDSTYSFRDGFYEKGDTVLPCKGSDLTVKRSFPGVTHALQDNQINTMSYNVGVIDPNTLQLTGVAYFDTIFFNRIDSYSIGSNSFSNCFRSKCYRKTYDATQQWVIIDTTFCIYAPDIGTIKTWNNTTTKTLRGYKRGSSTIWLAGVSIHGGTRQLAALRSAYNPVDGHVYSIFGQRMVARTSTKATQVLIGSTGKRLK